MTAKLIDGAALAREIRGQVAQRAAALTARGTRHLEELMAAVAAGHDAAVFFVVQRPDARRVVAARSIDPLFADTLARAQEAGVRVLARRCEVGWEGVTLGEAVEAGAG